jgi:hypothetical protein
VKKSVFLGLFLAKRLVNFTPRCAKLRRKITNSLARLAAGFFLPVGCHVKFYYGLTSFQMLQEAVYVVCDVLGHGSGNKAPLLMLETAAQETRCGTFKDPTPYGAGRGVFQLDLIAFEDISFRCPPKAYRLIKDEFGIDIRKCQHSQVDSSPLLAAIFCRIFYLLIPAQIPQTVEERAEYWKRYYNTVAGKGTALEYIANAAVLEQLEGEQIV